MPIYFDIVFNSSQMKPKCKLRCLFTKDKMGNANVYSHERRSDFMLGSSISCSSSWPTCWIPESHSQKLCKHISPNMINCKAELNMQKILRIRFGYFTFYAIMLYQTEWIHISTNYFETETFPGVTRQYRKHITKLLIRKWEASRKRQIL